MRLRERWNKPLMGLIRRLAAGAVIIVLARLSFADATGMVPGDIVLSNIANFPGHAGIYLGRWSLLPANIRQKHAKALAEAAVRSGCPEILDSYLVVDSMPSRGVRVSIMVEQFSDYHGATNAYFPALKKFDLPGALRFEADKGAVVKWPDLADNDPLRWKIVDEALNLAEARVPYDDTHNQFSTNTLPNAARRLTGGKLTLDCIAFCHYVYWQAAGMDLDVSYAVFHSPEQLYDYAKKNRCTRPLSFKPLLWDAAYLGLWKIKDTSVTTQGMSRAQAEAAEEEFGCAPGMRFQVRREGPEFIYSIYEVENGKRVGDPAKVKLDKMALSPVSAGAAAGSWHDGELQVTFYPMSAEEAMMTTSVSMSGKSMKITTILQRERRKLSTSR